MKLDINGVLKYKPECNMILVSEDNIEYSTNNVDWFELTALRELRIATGIEVYLRIPEEYRGNYINVKELVDTGIPNVITMDLVNDIIEEDGYITIKYTSGEETKITLIPNTEQSDIPDVDVMTVYTGREIKLEIKNYKPGTVYLSDNEHLFVKSDGVYIKALSTTTAFSELSFNLYALEPNKTPSTPKTVILKVINLELAKTSDVEDTEFIGGRLLSSETIEDDDIVYMENFDLED